MPMKPYESWVLFALFIIIVMLASAGWFAYKEYKGAKEAAMFVATRAAQVIPVPSPSGGGQNFPPLPPFAGQY